MKAHKYSVQFRITGDMNPGEVTQTLGLHPNRSMLAGEERNGRKCLESMWSYSGAPNGQFVQEWEVLEDGLNDLLEKLSPKKHLLQRYIDNYETVWWCGHFQASFDGGPTLSTALLLKLAAFGVPLFIDNYFSEE